MSTRHRKRRDRRVTNVPEVLHVEVNTSEWAGTFTVKTQSRSRDNETAHEINLTFAEAYLPHLIHELRKVVKVQQRRLADAERAFAEPTT